MAQKKPSLIELGVKKKKSILSLEHGLREGDTIEIDAQEGK
jgi:hypothetical protein